MLIVEKEYSSLEIVSCQNLYDEIVLHHSDCNGTGIKIKGVEVSDCICKLIYDYLLELTYARIPKGFWNVSLKQLKIVMDSEHHDFAARLLDEFKLFSGLIVGPSLSGKTSFLAIIGKLALLHHKSVMYITPEDIIQGSRQDADKLLINRLTGMELVLVDGIEKFNTKYENYILIVKNLLDKLWDNGTKLIVTTALEPEHFRARLSSDLENFLKKFSNVFITDLKRTHYENLSVENYLESELAKETKKYLV